MPKASSRLCTGAVAWRLAAGGLPRLGQARQLADPLCATCSGIGASARASSATKAALTGHQKFLHYVKAGLRTAASTTTATGALAQGIVTCHA